MLPDRGCEMLIASPVAKFALRETLPSPFKAALVVKACADSVRLSPEGKVLSAKLLLEAFVKVRLAPEPPVAVSDDTALLEVRVAD